MVQLYKSMNETDTVYVPLVQLGPQSTFRAEYGYSTDLHSRGQVTMSSECLPRKVDDDVVYVAEHAIAELVRERLRKRCLLVSANAWNSGLGFQGQKDEHNLVCVYMSMYTFPNAGAQVVNHAIMSAPRLAFPWVDFCCKAHSGFN